MNNAEWQPGPLNLRCKWVSSSNICRLNMKKKKYHPMHNCTAVRKSFVKYCMLWSYVSSVWLEMCITSNKTMKPKAENPRCALWVEMRTPINMSSPPPQTSQWIFLLITAWPVHVYTQLLSKWLYLIGPRRKQAEWMSSLLCSIRRHFEHKDLPTEAGVQISNLTLSVWHFTFPKG